jgi:hypothetical protein
MLRMALALAFGWLVAPASCDFPAPEHPAKLRAASEFGCNYDDIVLTERPDLSPRTVDVNACGHAARYTCVKTWGRAETCTREPMD